MKKVLFLACCGIGLTTAALAQENRKKDNAADLKPAIYTPEAASKKEIADKMEESRKTAPAVESSNAETAFKQLGLTDEQMSQMSEFSKRVGEKSKAINNNTNLTDAEKQTKLKELEVIKEKRYKEILGDALYAKYAELMKPKKSE